MNTGTNNFAEKRYDRQLAVVRDINELPVFNSLAPAKKRARRKQARRQTKKMGQDFEFKDWCMPEQPTRYIKSGPYDCL